MPRTRFDPAKAAVGPQINSERVLQPISERQFQNQVIGAATLFGWYTYHNPDSRRSTAGLPDLICIRPPRVLWVECKTDRGRLRPAQTVVIEMLMAAGQDVRVWRPSMWDAIVEALREVA